MRGDEKQRKSCAMGKKINQGLLKGKKYGRAEMWIIREVSLIMRSGESRKGQLHRIKMRQTDTFQSEKWIEPLTEATVYPDTIWRERERNGEFKLNKRTKKETERKRKKERGERIKRKKDILHPSRYILQTTKHYSGATIRGQALSQDHPFPPSSTPPST